MKGYTWIVFVIVFLISAKLHGNTNELKVTSTSQTNATAQSISTVDTFTRGGSTNLVRRSKLKNGEPQIVVHRFYNAGRLVADFISMRDSSGLVVEANLPVQFSFEFDAQKQVRSANIGTPNGTVLDSFGYTNGLFHPVPSETLKRANAVGEDLGKLFDPENVRKTTPEKFSQDVNELIKKHKK